MAEENNTQDELTNEEIEDVAESVPAPDEYPEGQAEELAESIDPENAVDEGVVAGLEASEEASNGPVAQAWDAGVSGVVDGIEAVGGAPHSPQEALAHDHHRDDIISIFGRTYAIPVPLYTFVFLVLGFVTALEVMLAELISSDIRIIPLLALSLLKAFLVVYYYMHLNIDSRIFAVVLLLAIGIAGLSAMFLVSVPSFGY